MFRHRPRRLAEQEGPVHPGAHQDQIGLLDRCVVRLLHLRQSGDGPALLRQEVGNLLGRLPRVSRQLSTNSAAFTPTILAGLEGLRSRSRHQVICSQPS